MAAPTPVRALVHSSTLVTAGVFLIFRFIDLVFFDFYFSEFLLFISCFTIFLSGITAFKETDIKKIVALSTLSNLGIIISSLSFGLFYLSFFHLITHAIFKALLFICSGFIIDFLFHCQDLRFIGDIFYRLPLISSGFIISNLSLCGFPFLSGFYSKDLIFERFFFFSSSYYLLIIYLSCIFLTSFYSFRFLYITIFNYNFSFNFYYLSSDSIFFFSSIFFLSIGGIVFGSLFFFLFFLIELDLILYFFLKILPFSFFIYGIFISYYYINYCFNIIKISHYSLLLNLFFLEFLSSQFFLYFINFFRKNLFYMVDFG